MNEGLGPDDVLMSGMVVKRAVSATVWKNWRPRYIVLRPGCIEWHKATGTRLEDEDAEMDDLPVGQMRLRPTTKVVAGGGRAHCLTLSTSGRVLQLDPTLALTLAPTLILALNLTRIRPNCLIFGVPPGASLVVSDNSVR